MIIEAGSKDDLKDVYIYDLPSYNGKLPITPMLYLVEELTSFGVNGEIELKEDVSGYASTGDPPCRLTNLYGSSNYDGKIRVPSDTSVSISALVTTMPAASKKLRRGLPPM